MADSVTLDDITVEVMDREARRLGAPSHREFLRYAPMSMKGAFNVACELAVENDRLRLAGRGG
jgi:hypothetical protein